MIIKICIPLVYLIRLKLADPISQNPVSYMYLQERESHEHLISYINVIVFISFPPYAESVLPELSSLWSASGSMKKCGGDRTAVRRLSVLQQLVGERPGRLTLDRS